MGSVSVLTDLTLSNLDMSVHLSFKPDRGTVMLLLNIAY